MAIFKLSNEVTGFRFEKRECTICYCEPSKAAPVCFRGKTAVQVVDLVEITTQRNKPLGWV